MPGSSCCYRHASAACNGDIFAPRPTVEECLFPCQDIARWPVKFPEQTWLTMRFVQEVSITIYNMFSSADCPWLLRDLSSVQNSSAIDTSVLTAQTPQSLTGRQTDFLSPPPNHLKMCETITVVIHSRCSGCSIADSAHTFKAAACYYPYTISCEHQYPDHSFTQTYEVPGGHDARLNGILCDSRINQRVQARHDNQDPTDGPPFVRFPAQAFQRPAANGA